MTGHGGTTETPRWGSVPRDAATTPRALRRWNAEVILDVLRGAPAATVTDLVSATGLSRPTVDAAIEELLGLGVVVELDPSPGGGPRRGRPGRRLAFSSDRGHLLGIDVGECTARAAVADLRGDVLAERVLRFPRQSRGGTHRLAGVEQVIGEAVRAAGISVDQVLAAGIGISGGVEPATGRIAYSGALPAGLDVGAALGLPCPVLVDNDANLAARGELWRGAGRGVQNLICVLAGERLGAGLVVNGQLVRGHGGAAGEMAFLGPFADDTGAEGISQHVRVIAADRTPGTDPASVDVPGVFAAASAGDPVALDVVARAVARPARATATLALVLNPELVVVAGGVARAGSTLLAPFRAHMAELTRVLPRIAASPLAERAVLVGAVRTALDHVEAHVLDELGTDAPSGPAYAFDARVTLPGSAAGLARPRIDAS